MKVSLKYLLSIMMALFCALAMVSCGGKDDPDPDPDPEPEEISTFRVGSKECDIKSIGAYRSVSDKGYQFVVASETLDLTKTLYSAPKGYVMVIDIPEKYCGKEYNVKDIKDDVDSKGDGWYFIVYYVEDGVASKEITVDDDAFDSGKITLTFGLHKYVTCAVSITLKNGTKLECKYSGKYQKSDVYICSWL